MKKLKFDYKMQLSFCPSIWKHTVNLRCIPPDTEYQQIYGLSYQIQPTDSIICGKDGFGNHTLLCSSYDFHDYFECEVQGVAYVNQADRAKEKLHPMYRYPSRLTQPDNSLGIFYQNCYESFPDKWKNTENNNWDKAQYLMQALYQHYHYAYGNTTINTTAEEALTKGQGVCQDYAHIHIALCRLAGIPARYVAGFMCGEGATHAWTEVYADGMWRALDPTHNRIVTDEYISIAHGRDFGDCAMEQGIFFGVTNQSQQILVQVREIIW